MTALQRSGIAGAGVAVVGADVNPASNESRAASARFCSKLKQLQESRSHERFASERCPAMQIPERPSKVPK